MSSGDSNVELSRKVFFVQLFTGNGPGAAGDGVLWLGIKVASCAPNSR